MQDAAKRAHLALMQYESQIAALLLFHAEAQEDYKPTSCQAVRVRTAPPLADIFRSTDPLANIDPKDHSGALSPVGLVHLFRQYFFELDTFLGEPVEHVWLAPGTTVELIEVSTRRTLVERTRGGRRETHAASRASQRSRTKSARRSRRRTTTSTKLGVSTSARATVGVYQGAATASFSIDTTRRMLARTRTSRAASSREAVHGDQAQLQVDVPDGHRDDRHAQPPLRGAEPTGKSSSTTSCGARCAASGSSCRTSGPSCAGRCSSTIPARRSGSPSSSTLPSRRTSEPQGPDAVRRTRGHHARR